MKKILLLGSVIALAACSSGLNDDMKQGGTAKVCRDGTTIIRGNSGKLYSYKATEIGFLSGELAPETTLDNVCQS